MQKTESTEGCGCLPVCRAVMVSHSLQGRSTHSQLWAEPGKDQSLPLISESLGAQFSDGLQAQPCHPGVTHPPLPGAALALCGARSTACPPHGSLHSSTALQSALKGKKLFSQHFISTNVSRLVSQCAINPALVFNSAFMLAPFISF